MKRLNFPGALFACSLFTIHAFGSWKCWGSAVIQKKTFQVENITSVSVSCPLKVIIKQGDKESICLEAEENIIPLILVNQEGNALTIKAHKSFTAKKELICRITVKNLDSVDFSSAGTLKIDECSRKNLTIKLSGACNLDANLDLEYLKIQASGSCQINIFGTIKNQKINLSGAAYYDAYSVCSDLVDIKIAGTSSTHINAKKIIGNIAGVSQLFCNKLAIVDVIQSELSHVTFVSKKSIN